MMLIHLASNVKIGHFSLLGRQIGGTIVCSLNFQVSAVANIIGGLDFRKDLQGLAKRPQTVPVFDIKQILEELFQRIFELKGRETLGLFRLSGDCDDVDRCSKHVDSGNFEMASIVNTFYSHTLSW